MNRALIFVAASLATLVAGCGNQGSLSGAYGQRSDGGWITYPDGRTVFIDGGLPPGTCADVSVNTRRVIPTVMIIVDRSGSMTDDFGAASRWDTMRNALLDPDGLIREFEGNVRFGLATYTGIDEGPGPHECPSIQQIDPAMMNYETIRAMYAAAEPLQETPTGDAMNAILDRLLSLPDPPPGPTVFLLATDGEPDTCEVPNPQMGQGEALAAVRRAHEARVRTFVLSVGRDVSAGHLQEMAAAGVGRAGAPYWVAGDDAGLRRALHEIISGEVSCTLELRGRIDPEYACEGVVRMFGRDAPLECGTDWRPVDATHIELLGDACTSLLESPAATIEARFPCHSVLI